MKLLKILLLLLLPLCINAQGIFKQKKSIKITPKTEIATTKIPSLIAVQPTDRKILQDSILLKSYSKVQLDSLIKVISDSLQHMKEVTEFQLDSINKAKEATRVWKFPITIGLSLSHTVHSAATATGGGGKEGFVMANSFDIAANYFKKERKFRIKNKVNWSFGLTLPNLKGTPLQKSTDNFKMINDISTAFSKNNKWAFNLAINSSTSIFTVFDGNFLSDVRGNGATRKFLNPYNISFAPGIKYEPNEIFSVSISPLSLNILGVPNDEIAQKGLHIQDTEDDGITYKKQIIEKGAQINMTYVGEFKTWWLADYRMIINSAYLEDIKKGNLDLTLINNFKITKTVGLQHRLLFLGDFSAFPFAPFFEQMVMLSYKVKI